MNDSRWLYDNDDEDYAAKLQVKVPAARGKHQIGAVKVPSARLKSHTTVKGTACGCNVDVNVDVDCLRMRAALLQR